MRQHALKSCRGRGGRRDERPARAAPWTILVAVVVACVAIGCGGEEGAPQEVAEGGAAAAGPALLSADELSAALEENDALVVLDTRGRGEYDAGHVAGALPAPIEELDPPVRAELDESTRELLAGRLAALGIGGGVPVVVVDRGSREGFQRAAHACWLVSLAGAGPCRVLEGGMRSWSGGGHPVATEPAAPKSAGNVKITTRPATFADMELMRAAVFDGRSALVGIQDNPVAPSIPGAWHVSLLELVDARGVVDRERLEEIIRLTGLKQESEAIVFGDGPQDGAAGWFLLGPVSGIANARLFAAGMRHWSTHPHLPKTGAESEKGAAASQP